MRVLLIALLAAISYAQTGISVFIMEGWWSRDELSSLSGELTKIMAEQLSIDESNIDFSIEDLDDGQIQLTWVVSGTEETITKMRKLTFREEVKNRMKTNPAIATAMTARSQKTSTSYDLQGPWNVDLLKLLSDELTQSMASKLQIPVHDVELAIDVLTNGDVQLTWDITGPPERLQTLHSPTFDTEFHALLSSSPEIASAMTSTSSQKTYNCMTKELWSDEKTKWCNKYFGTTTNSITTVDKSEATVSVESTVEEGAEGKIYNCMTKEVWSEEKLRWCKKFWGATTNSEGTVPIENIIEGSEEEEGSKTHWCRKQVNPARKLCGRCAEPSCAREDLCAMRVGTCCNYDCVLNSHFCAASLPQLCNIDCPPPTCADGQCASRSKSSCCEYQCEEDDYNIFDENDSSLFGEYQFVWWLFLACVIGGIIGFCCLVEGLWQFLLEHRKSRNEKQQKLIEDEDSMSMADWQTNGGGRRV